MPWRTLIFVSIFLAFSGASALSKKITSANVSQFRNSAANKNWVCFNDPIGVRRVGVLTSYRSRIRSGESWSEFSAAQTTQKNASVRSALKKIKSSNKKYRELRTQLKSLETLKRTREAAVFNCFSDKIPSTSEFTGQPDSLEPYRDNLTVAEVDHLLSKVAYGGNAELRRIGYKEGLLPLVDALVDGSRFTANANEIESNAQFYEKRELNDSDKFPGLKIWTVQAAVNGALYRMLFSPLPFKEWMTQFWAAHFAVNIDRLDFGFNTYTHLGIPAHVALLRNNALTDFRAMAVGMIDDSAMCTWLNNDDNRVDAPNQNFAREFMELFTLGAVDPITQVPNYGEDSVAAATAFFSGFYEDSRVTEPFKNYSRIVTFDPELHSTATVSVFSGIPNASTTRAFAPAEFANYVLDNHPGSARYIAEKLFAQMVRPDVPASIVGELSQALKKDGFKLPAVLKRILKSNAMFSKEALSVCVRSPVEEMTELVRALTLTPFKTDLNKEQQEAASWMLTNLSYKMSDAGQTIFQPPSVFGWKDACGVNRGGRTARGEGWLTDQAILNRDRGCVAIMNTVPNVLETNLKDQLLPKTLLDWEQAIDIVSRERLRIRLSPQQRGILEKFMSTEWDDNNLEGSRVILSKASPEYMTKKLQRLVCLINGLTSTQMR